MNDDRHSHEALSFGMFFDNPLHQLQKFDISRRSRIQNQERQAKEARDIVESFVDVANSKMRGIHGYSRKLREPVLALYNHVLQVADEIPPPIDLNFEVFETNPLINALFVNSRDINKLFTINPCVDAYLRTHDKCQVPVLYALLTATKSEKRTLGVGLLGDEHIRDVPLQAVNFSRHKIHIPCDTRAKLNTTLKEYLFIHVVALVKQEMMSRMTNQLFKPGDDYYASRVKSLVNPEVYLNTLLEYIEIPDNLLSIDKVHLKLSKLGFKLEGDDRQRANEFDIHELTWSNHIRSVVLQIAYVR